MAGKSLRRRLACFALVLAASLGAAFLYVVGFTDSEALALKRFDRIQSGMTRKQLLELMADIPRENATGGSSRDSWEVEGGYVLVAQYDVKPRGPATESSDDENWTIREVWLANMSPPSTVSHVLAWLGLWSRPKDRGKIFAVPADSPIAPKAP